MKVLGYEEQEILNGDVSLTNKELIYIFKDNDIEKEFKEKLAENFLDYLGEDANSLPHPIKVLMSKYSLDVAKYFDMDSVKLFITNDNRLIVSDDKRFLDSRASTLSNFLSSKFVFGSDVSETKENLISFFKDLDIKTSVTTENHNIKFRVSNNYIKNPEIEKTIQKEREITL